ncbi:MAG: undecaprenyl-diphosphate phosphatase, partial [Waterburya sp.]
MFRQTKKYLRLICFLSFGLIFSVILSQFGQNTVWASSAGFIVSEASAGKAEGISQVNLFQAIVLGFVQGATEFIPISSTAHLKAVPVFFGWGDPG